MAVDFFAKISFRFCVYLNRIGWNFQNEVYREISILVDVAACQLNSLN